jgi:PKD repeat protein
LKADFNWEQTYCTPNQIQFTDASEADSAEPIVFWLWELYDLNGTTILSTQTLQNINYTYATYPTGTQAYKICLTVTNSFGDTDKVCKDISFSDACKAEFQWNYTGCNQQGPFTVNFINKSVVALCPAVILWNFGDPSSSTNTSNVFSPSHIYNNPGTYPVTLTMTDAAANTCTGTNLVTVQPCGVEVRTIKCPDCSVVYDIIAPNPTGSFKWSFPSGIPDKSEATKVKVKYPGPGTYAATLTVTTSNFCTCTIQKLVTITAADCNCCARNDRQKDTYDFSYNGKDYRMKYKFVQVNLPLLLYIKGKTKLKKKNSSGIYRAAKASEIQVKWEGKIYTSASDCNCAVEQAENQDRFRTNKTKSKKTHHIGAKFRTRKDSLTSTHYLKVDSNHNGVTQTLMLGKDCI